MDPKWFKCEESVPPLNENVICRNDFECLFIASFYGDFWIYLFPLNGFELGMSNCNDFIGRKVHVKEWLKIR